MSKVTQAKASWSGIHDQVIGLRSLHFNPWPQVAWVLDAQLHGMKLMHVGVPILLTSLRSSPNPLTSQGSLTSGWVAVSSHFLLAKGKAVAQGSHLTDEHSDAHSQVGEGTGENAQEIFPQPRNQV